MGRGLDGGCRMDGVGEWRWSYLVACAERERRRASSAGGANEWGNMDE
jgi:hypothetical protein